VVFLCLHGLDKAGAWRWLCLAVLACLAAKICVEMEFGSSFVLAVQPGNFVPVPESHAVGAAAALLLFLWSRHAVRRVVEDAHRSPVTGHRSRTVR